MYVPLNSARALTCILPKATLASWKPTTAFSKYPDAVILTLYISEMVVKTIAGVRGFPVVKVYVENRSKFTMPIKAKRIAGLHAWNIIATMLNLVSFLLANNE